MSKPVLVISAHLDDAVLSCGQFIEGRKGNVDVLTVFSGIPKKKGLLTDYDKACGFNSSEDAVVVRREEDREACAILNANPIHLNYMDSQYENKVNELMVWTDVYNYASEDKYEMVLIPLGLRHPDHILISSLLLKNGLQNLYLYEDLPHRVIHPEFVFERLKKFSNAKLTFIGDGSMTEKLRALWCYKSQMGRGDLNIHNICVSERFWKV